MKLYDFSLYAAKRAELTAAREVKKAASNLNEPGTILYLKKSVQEWMSLHRDILQKKISS